MSLRFINQAPHHEDKWGYSSIFLNPSYEIQASGQVHTLVVLLPVKKIPNVSIGQGPVARGHSVKRNVSPRLEIKR
jgi:hypothetical protein